MENESLLFDVHAHCPEKTVGGAGHFFCASGYSFSTNNNLMGQINSFANGYFSLGLAPQEVIREKEPEKLFDKFMEQVSMAQKDKQISKKFVAIGEVGLDFHWAKTSGQRNLQMEIFCKICEFSLKENLPLVVHSRNAEKEVIGIMESAGCKSVLMHCFGGGLELARHVESLGWLISIPPIPSKQRKKIIKGAKTESIVLESDAPYIGKKSADALESAKLVSRHREIGLDVVLAQTKGNAMRFFNIQEVLK